MNPSVERGRPDQEATAMPDPHTGHLAHGPVLSQGVHATVRSAPTSPASALLRRYPLLSFFGIAFAISWTYVIVLEVIWPLPDTIVTDTPVLLGPVVAGFVMTAVTTGREGVRELRARIVAWRVPARWYAVPLLVVPALYLAGLALVPGALASGTAPAATTIALYPALFVVMAFLGGPVLEEPGWRGFALPRLQRRWGPSYGTVFLGLAWALWHAPQYLTPTFAASNGGRTILGFIAFAVALTSFSILITWVFNHTGASVFMAIVMHTCLNFSQAVTSDLFPSAADNEVGPAVVMAVVATILVVATRGRLGYPALADEPYSGPVYPTRRSQQSPPTLNGDIA
jgi:uncharacterized protein